jgi:hypothetical protein
MDGEDPRTCRSGVKYRNLDHGRHRFAVWAVDGGAPLAEASHSFKVLR